MMTPILPVFQGLRTNQLRPYSLSLPIVTTFGQRLLASYLELPKGSLALALLSSQLTCVQDELPKLDT